MKKASRIILLIAGILYVILGAAFSFIEARFLVSGDAALYAHPLLGISSALFRLFAGLFLLASGIIALFFYKPKDRPVLKVYLYAFAVATFLLLNGAAAYLKEAPGASPTYLTLPLSLTGDLYFIGAVFFFLSDSAEGKNAENENPEPK
jgi:hypothetical protein